jgi:histidinol phosphatase-like enzyme
MKKKLKKNVSKIDEFYFCLFYKDGIIKRFKKDSLLRKSNIGMFFLVKET